MWHGGLAADLLEGTAAPSTANDLLGLVAHPFEIVVLTALEEACKLWPKDSKLTWAALILAFSLCHVPSRPRDQPRQHSEALHTSNEAQAAVNAALAFYEHGSGWAPLPLPPPAWVKVEPGKGRRGHQRYEDYDVDDATDAAEVWGEPDVFWHSKQAAEVLQRIPFDEVLNSSANSVLLDFLASVLDWTNQKNAPPWVKPGRRDRSATQIFEWTHTLGSRLGYVAGLIPLVDFQARFLDPILSLEGDNCWLSSRHSRAPTSALTCTMRRSFQSTQLRYSISVSGGSSRNLPSSATPTGAENFQASINPSLFAR